MKKTLHSLSRRIAALCALALLLALFPLPASAEDGDWTQAQAVEFALSLVGQQIDVDNESYDCVDIAKEYFYVVGGHPYTSLTILCGSPSASNYAYAVSDGAIPENWVRMYFAEGYRPQPGDVAVWDRNVGPAGADGHVAVVVQTDGENIVVVDQDSQAQRAAALSDPIPADQPTCYIVPTFNQSTFPARYTVLVLDASGAQTFEELPNWMNLNGSTYVSDSSLEAVKSAAAKFLDDAEHAVGKNYIAIVTYAEEATVVSGFTTDIQALKEALASVTCEELSNRSICAGLECACSLLESLEEENAVKNLLLCTTGLTDQGKYDYEGLYGSGVVASSWYNKGTQIKLYAYANSAIACADRIKAMGTTLYVLGIFAPIEAGIPSNSGVRDVAQFLRMTAKDLASSEEVFYSVEDVENLEFFFGEMQEDLSGTGIRRLYHNSNAMPKDAHWDDTGGSMHLGGYAEDFMWGPALFEVPSTQLFRSSIRSSETVNYNLAILCGCLCAAAADHEYLWQAYKDLGFQDEDVYLYSYPDSPHNRSSAQRDGRNFASDKDLAFSIGVQTILIGGVKTDLMVINCRGTVTGWEGIKDGTCVADKEFYGYIAWDWIYEFYQDVFAGLEDYRQDHSWLGTRPLKILVCGHSLGGAAADLIAARFDMECGGSAWYASGLTRDDVYAYTFGALDSIIDKNASGSPVQLPVTEGFNNILNIYNYLDTFGPGRKLINARGNTVYGKFGCLYTFSDDRTSAVSPDSLYRTHEIVGYIAAIREGLPAPEYRSGMVRVCIRCPVDVEVTSGREILCEIRDDQLISADPRIRAVVEGSEKTLLLPKELSCRLLITATDNGSMEVEMQDMDPDLPALTRYENIALETGKRISGDLTAEDGTEDIALFVVNDKGTRMAEIQPDGTEKRVKKEPERSRAGEEKDGFLDSLWAARGAVLAGLGILIFLLTAATVLILVLTAAKRKKKKAAASGVIRCSCGADNPAGMLYCSRCGRPL